MASYDIELAVDTNTRQGPEVVLDASPFFLRASDHEIEEQMSWCSDLTGRKFVSGMPAAYIFDWLAKNSPSEDSRLISDFLASSTHPNTMLCARMLVPEYKRGLSLRVSHLAVDALLDQ